MAAAGIVSLQLLGHYDDPAVVPALEYLSKVPVEWKRNQVQYFYYFHYYAIQANYQAGGKWWDDWHPRVREMLSRYLGEEVIDLFLVVAPTGRRE
jgi:hypothetical protein